MAESILIVDDEPAILNSLSKILEDEGYQVAMAKSGHEALKMLAADPAAIGMTIAGRALRNVEPLGDQLEARASTDRPR